VLELEDRSDVHPTRERYSRAVDRMPSDNASTKLLGAGMIATQLLLSDAMSAIVSRI
jgi:hypothetical protein